ncbi:MAG: hypothetical protein R2717_08350 [Schumannella sp.]
MRFVIAIVLFVAALVTIGLGIAQRTILAGPDSFSTTVETGSAPITVVDGAVLNALPGTQRVTVTGSGAIFLAYGRDSDVLAWVGDLAYNHVTYEPGDAALTVRTVPGGGTDGVGETATPTPAPSAPSPTATDSADAVELVPFSGAVPDPRGSDLWVQEFERSNELVRKINAPQGISLIIMSDGIAAAPGSLEFEWPLDNSAPASGPLLIAGILSLLAGLVVFLWALVHARRRRGPRRKHPKLPRSPQPKRLKRAPQRKELTTGQRTMAAAGGILSVSLLLSGCAVGGGVLGSGIQPTPEPTNTDIGEANDLKPTAVTEQQLGRIVGKLLDVVAQADTDKDAKLAATRLAGPALAARTASYIITKKDPKLAAIAALPAGDVALALPQQNDSWPRSVFAVIEPADSTLAPVALMLAQESPRENYKVHYLMTLEPGLVIPPVAPAQLGAVQLQADNALGLLPPDQLAEAYGDILTLGEKAEQFTQFDAETDTLRLDIGYEAKQKRKKDLPSQAKIEFTHNANVEAPISFPTNDSGQIVAVALDDIETVTPVEAGAAINAKGTVKALSGRAQSTKGFVATYGVQLLFYVPPVGGDGATSTIQLLGFSSDLVAAKEVN